MFISSLFSLSFLMLKKCSCDDYSSHQIVPINCYSEYSSMRNLRKKSCQSLNFHPYESIPEYILTMNRSFHQQRISSRSIRKDSTSQCQCSTNPTRQTEEESSTPLLLPSSTNSTSAEQNQRKKISQWTNL